MKVQNFWKRSIGHAAQKVKQDFEELIPSVMEEVMF